MHEPAAPRSKLILLDNDAGIVELAAWFLERKGYAVRTASSFAEARELCAREQPDLLLSDIDLGAESGADELPRLSAAGELPPTLVVSGYLDAEIAERLRALPEVLGTLVKPFDLPVLESRIHECLERASTLPRVARPRAPSRASEPPAPPPRADEWIEIRPYDPASGAPRSRGPGPAALS